jgi:hypothetical protein
MIRGRGKCRKGDDNSPIVIVERPQLRKVTVERGYRFRPYAPECSDLENLPCHCGLCQVSGVSVSKAALLTGNHQVLSAVVTLGKYEPRLD